jgi:hypothetical protein
MRCVLTAAAGAAANASIADAEHVTNKNLNVGFMALPLCGK